MNNNAFFNDLKTFRVYPEMRPSKQFERKTNPGSCPGSQQLNDGWQLIIADQSLITDMIIVCVFFCRCCC